MYWLVGRTAWTLTPLLLIGAAVGALVGSLVGANTWHEYAAWTVLGFSFVAVLVLCALQVRHRGRNLVAEAHSLADLRALPWDQFEELVAEVFRMKGWTASATRREGDGGADVVLSRGRRRALVQCKSWRQWVGVDDIRAFYGVMTAEHVEAGFFVTTSDFFPEAERFASSVGIDLIRGNRLLRNVEQLKRGGQDEPHS